MGLYNPSYLHQPRAYIVDNSELSILQCSINGVTDVMTVWLAESALPLWVRGWLAILLLGGYLLPFAFIPHPFGITNAVCYFVMIMIAGPMLVQIRGMDKNAIAVAQYIACTPILVINILSLTTDWIGDEQLTWDNADTGYEKARVVACWINTVIYVVSLLFDLQDSYQYWILGNQAIVRSKWTTEQLESGDCGMKRLEGAPETVKETPTMDTIPVLGIRD